MIWPLLLVLLWQTSDTVVDPKSVASTAALDQLKARLPDRCPVHDRRLVLLEYKDLGGYLPEDAVNLYLDAKERNPFPAMLMGGCVLPPASIKLPACVECTREFSGRFP